MTLWNSATGQCYGVALCHQHGDWDGQQCGLGHRHGDGDGHQDDNGHCHAGLCGGQRHPVAAGSGAADAHQYTATLQTPLPSPPLSFSSPSPLLFFFLSSSFFPLFPLLFLSSFSSLVLSLLSVSVSLCCPDARVAFPQGIAEGSPFLPPDFFAPRCPWRPTQLRCDGDSAPSLTARRKAVGVVTAHA